METAEKDEIAMAWQTKMKAPLRWVSPAFVNIIDLKEDHYDQVIRLIKHHYFDQDPMCRALSIKNDEESMKGFLDLVKVWMKDSTSIVALSSASGRVIGTAITRINSRSDKTNTYSRIQIFSGEVLEKIMHLKSQVVKQADVYNYFNSDKVFRVYIVSCHPSYQGNEVEKILLETCIDVASSLDIVAVVGVFTSGFGQSVAKDLTFEVLSEIRYSRWIVDDEIVFRDPGIGNYSAAFMGAKVPGSEEMERRHRARKSRYRKMAAIAKHRSQ